MLADLIEVAPFRQFATKVAVVDAALDQVTEGFRGRPQSPTDELEADLVALAERHVAFIDSWPALADRVLPESVSDPDLGNRPTSILERNATAVRGLVLHHQPDPSESTGKSPSPVTRRSLPDERAVQVDTAVEPSPT